MPGVSIVAQYETASELEGAANRLKAAGFAADQMSIVTQDLETEKQARGYVTVGDMARDGARAGAWIGGLLGLVLGAAVGRAPLVQGGWWVTTAAAGVDGIVIGALGGLLCGLLLGVTVMRERVLKYEAAAGGNKYLLIVSCSASDAAQAGAILDRAGGSLRVYTTQEGPAAPR